MKKVFIYQIWNITEGEKSGILHLCEEHYKEWERQALKGNVFGEKIGISLLKCEKCKKFTKKRKKNEED